MSDDANEEPAPRTHLPCLVCGRAIRMPPAELAAGDRWPCDPCAADGQRQYQSQWRTDRLRQHANYRRTATAVATGKPAP